MMMKSSQKLFADENQEATFCTDNLNKRFSNATDLAAEECTESNLQNGKLLSSTLSSPRLGVPANDIDLFVF